MRYLNVNYFYNIVNMAFMYFYLNFNFSAIFKCVDWFTIGIEV